MAETTRRTHRRRERLQTVADAIRRMKEAPSGSERNMLWNERHLGELDAGRGVDGFSMALWLAGPRTISNRAHQDGCSTLGCIAGTAATIFRKEADELGQNLKGSRLADAAARILGLDIETASSLFWGPTTVQAHRITREQAATACEKTGAGCAPADIWTHLTGAARA